jgi:tRNA A-37 threonylcarbamoyl transferase component Bud32
MGAVYRAEHTLMKKVLAVKVLHPELSRLDEVARRFEREAQSASRLSHEHIIQVTDFGRTPDGALYLVMEYLSGESLADALDSVERMPVRRATGIARQILSALEHAHAQGVVHRDLKPDNIMLVARGTMPPVDFIKILDFGIAKMTAASGSQEGDPTSLTQAGVVFGTPDYMSPEQALGEDTDARADLYACGIILYEMLTGRRPFEAPSRMEVLSMHLTAEPAPPRQRAPDAGISPALEQVVLGALRKRRTERYPTASAFLAALDAAEAQPALAVGAARAGRSSWPDRLRPHVATTWHRLPEPMRRLAPVFGIAALALVFVGITVLRRPAHGPASTPPAPQAAPPAVQAPVKLAEEALSRGDLVRARTILTEQLHEHPEAARVHYLMGNVEFLSHEPQDGLSAYREAIRRDPGYRNDAALLHNVRGLLDDRHLGDDAFGMMTHDIGLPAADTIAQVASTDRRFDRRQAARAACAEIGCTQRIDRLSSYVLDLQQGKTCEERLQAVRHLRDLGDARAVPAVRRARTRRAGFLGLGNANDCLRKEADEAIRSLERR